MRFGDFEPADALDVDDLFDAVLEGPDRDLLGDVLDLLADVVRAAEAVANLVARRG